MKEKVLKKRPTKKYVSERNKKENSNKFLFLEKTREKIKKRKNEKKRRHPKGGKGL